MSGPGLAHHLAVGPEVIAGNGGLGRVFLLPGSPGRAERIASHFTDAVRHDNPRRHDVFVGTVQVGDARVDVGTVATGMGCPSLGIIVSELLALGARCLLRVGTAGTLQPDHVPVGGLVIATGAVRDEGTSDALCPRDVPAVAHPDAVAALSRAATALGLADHTFRGLVHAKDTFYGREVASGPLAAQSAAYMAMLEAAGVLATEMESSHLFILGQVHGADRRPLSARGPDPQVVIAGTVLAVIGSTREWGDAALAARTEAQAIEVALRGAVELVHPR